MFRAILYTQWRWARGVVLFGVIASFALPLLAVQPVPGFHEAPGAAADALEYLAGFGPAFPLLASLLAIILGISAWGADHAGRHVYALTLPLPRWQLVWFRFGAGLLLLTLPILALWLGNLVAISTLELPPGLRGYPTLLAVRFALAAVVAFALCFSISAGTTRTAGLLLALIAGLVVGQFVLLAMSRDLNILGPVFDGLFVWPGPFDVFSGRWMLIDV